MITRIGGKQSTVKMGPGTKTAWQHDPRVLSDGDITVFDNGANPKVHPYSRGILERLDHRTNTMRLVAQETHSPALSAGTQGNLQALPNGDILIGWGSQPYVSEYSSTGRLLFNADMSTPDQSYRAFRFQWTAQPTSRPGVALSAKRSGAPQIAYVSWNGTTSVRSWRVLAGPTKRRLRPVSTVARSGFETPVSLASAGPWFEVQALDQNGVVLGSSVASNASSTDCSATHPRSGC